MKITVNAVKQLTPVDIPVDELVRKIGSQLGEVEGVDNLGEKYQGVVVAKVISCEDHPNADRLHVCMVDDGGRAEGVERNEQGLVQVVCGATNVREGLLVAWLPPGSTVPESVGKDPFVLEARELRGVISNGMLASPRELALGEDHDGILEIDKDAQPGQDFASVYKLDDYVIDIENKMFTHRPDCFGILGVAREIAGITGQQFTSPDWYQPQPSIPAKAAELPLTVTNELTDLVPRFSAMTLADVTIKPSPEWLQVILTKLGQKPINNVVDLTNFYMLLTGQPLHAYDYDKVKQRSSGDTATIVVRHPHTDETIRLINDKVITPRPEAIMIVTDQQAIGLGGVMGGADTEVDEHTKNLILEAASFDMYSIRRTSMAHGLFTDAVTRFNKGQSPLQTMSVLAKVADELQKLAEAKVASEVIDLNQVEGRQWVHPPVSVGVDFINERLGSQLSVEDMKQLLQHVEFAVETNESQLTVTAPFWRTDIELREDVVEEIGRLYGYDKLPQDLPMRRISPVQKDLQLTRKQQIRDVLSRSGANEVLSYTFVHGNLLDKVGQDKSHSFQLSNALSPDLQYYRLSVLPSLLEKIHPNLKSGHDEFALFELGKAHSKTELDDAGLPTEFDRVSLVLAADAKTAKQRSGAAYYRARRFAELLVGDDMQLLPLNQADLQGHVLTEQMCAPFEPSRSAAMLRDNRVVGVIGEFTTSVRKALKLPDYCAGFELFLSATRSSAAPYQPLSRFPSVHQDITLRVAQETAFADVSRVVDEALRTNAPDESLCSLESLSIYRSNDDDAHKNLTFRITVTPQDRTLTDKETSLVIAAIATAAHEQCGAEQL